MVVEGNYQLAVVMFCFASSGGILVEFSTRS